MYYALCFVGGLAAGVFAAKYYYSKVIAEIKSAQNFAAQLRSNVSASVKDLGKGL